MRKLFVFAVLVTSMARGSEPCAGVRCDRDPWEKIQFLMGEWIGEGTGDPGHGTGEYSFVLDLDKKVLIRKSSADYPAANGRRAFSHHDLMIVYPENESLRADYFDNEGHVIHYKVQFPAVDAVEFSNDQYRLTYRKLSDSKVGIKFEIRPAGKNFATYIDATATKKP